MSRCVSSRPRAPWHDDSLNTAKRERRKVESKWRKTGLEKHRQIYQLRKKDVRRKGLEVKREHINHKICMSTSTKEHFKISSDLMGTSGSSPAPDLPKHELPDVFADFFDQKIRQLRENIDSAGDGPEADPFDHDSSAPFAVSRWLSSTRSRRWRCGRRSWGVHQRALRLILFQPHC